MHINDLPDSTNVFIDANIFIYHFAGISKQLKKRPDLVKNLTQYSQDVQDIIRTPLSVESVTKADLLASAQIRSTHGMLTNDSVILATMKRVSIVDFVTHDNDFDHIAKLKLWKPDDI